MLGVLGVLGILVGVLGVLGVFVCVLDILVFMIWETYKLRLLSHRFLCILCTPLASIPQIGAEPRVASRRFRPLFFKFIFY